MKLYDLAKMTTATTGTGSITLAAAVAPFLTFDQAGVVDQDTVSYGIFDPPNTEVGFGIYTTSTKNLTRTVKRSTGAGNTAAISLSGNAYVFISALAEDFYTIAQPNILINPFMEIDQANEGASVALTSGTAKYVADGWQAVYNSTATGVTAQRVADGPLTYPNSIKFTVGTGGTTTTATNLYFYQTIEANNLTEIAPGNAAALGLSVSFWVKSSIGSYVMSAAFTNLAGTRGYASNVTVNSSATWEKKTIYIPGDVTGTWVTSGTAGGALLVLTAAAGSSYQSANNTWAGGNALATAANTNTILSTSGATFQITGVKLEASPVPTPYGRLNFADEMTRCQRYYEKSYDLGTAPGGVTNNGATIFFVVGLSSGTDISLSFFYKVTKRIVPTLTKYSPGSGASGKIYNPQLAADVTPVDLAGGTNGFTIYGLVSPTSTIELSAHFVADARL